ncbi:MAG: hypothetical protein PHW96_00880 [Candidatus Nanoarchaeia archaeon]|nr:hypothetical protein [Candidatus Nanoarchaeia archaeon]
MFDKKSTIEKYEDEFKSDKLKHKHVFYDLYITTGDPEEMRAFTAELLDDADYSININKLTDFEDVGVEGIFKGGKLKPLQSIIKGVKSHEKGVKHSFLWKFFAGFGALLFLLVLLFKASVPYPDFFYLGGTVFLILSFITYLVKDKIDLMLWVKISGIYNVEESKADIRVVIAGDTAKKDKEAIKLLDDDLNEIYQVIARKYIKLNKKKEEKITVVKKDTAEEKVIKALRESQSQLELLDKRLLKKEITEDTYKDVKVQLVHKKRNLETMMDLIETLSDK